MRRTRALLLLSVIAFWLIAPAMPGNTNVPACCRPGGKHHCAMGRMEAPDEPAGPALKAAIERCPFLPVVATAAPGFLAFSPSAGGVLPAAVPLRLLPIAAVCHRRPSLGRIHQKRGPPFPLA